MNADMNTGENAGTNIGVNTGLNTGIELTRAEVMSEAQFRQALTDLDVAAEAGTEAQKILANAEAEAAAIVARAQDHAAEVERRLADHSEESLSRFLNEDVVDLSAGALVQLFAQSRQIREDMEHADRWLRPLVETAILRIIGSLPQEQVMSAVLVQSLSELRERWDLAVRCHPSLQELISDVVSEDSRLSGAIREVQVDRALGLEELRLVSGQGILDIGVTTQVETFLRAVERYLGEEEG